MKLIKASIVTFLLAGLSIPAIGQDAEKAEETPPPAAFPETEIFLFDYDVSGDDALSGGKNVTSRPGYDNQPYFTKNSETFLYSRDDGTQTDIWEYDIADGMHRQVTDNDKSEFSPTPSPDNSKISTVFERNLSVWTVNRDNPDNPKWTFETANIEEPVGYFAHDFETGDIIYWSRYGFNVALTHADKADYHYISGNALPATPHVIPGTNTFSFVHRQGNDQVWIKSFDPETKAITPLTPVVGSNINYTWAPDGSILQIEDTGVHRWTKASGKWDQISDLSNHGLKSANRIAVSPDGTKIAIVGLPAPVNGSAD